MSYLGVTTLLTIFESKQNQSDSFVPVIVPVRCVFVIMVQYFMHGIFFVKFQMFTKRLYK